MVECLNCGKRRTRAADECPRCAYVGWVAVEDLSRRIRRRLRERVLTHRRRGVAR
jgi:hypothetical protein